MSRTYQGVDRYTKIALYIGNEDWNIGLELCGGMQHLACKTNYFIERIFPLIQRLCCRGESIPMEKSEILPEVTGLIAEIMKKTQPNENSLRH